MVPEEFRTGFLMVFGIILLRHRNSAWGNDHLLLRILSSPNQALFRFIAFYLLLIALYLICWFFFPLIALDFHLIVIVSVPFGQDSFFLGVRVPKLPDISFLSPPEESFFSSPNFTWKSWRGTCCNFKGHRRGTKYLTNNQLRILSRSLFFSTVAIQSLLKTLGERFFRI